MNTSNRCPVCGQPLRPTSVYCPNCGSHVESPPKRLCRTCGAELKPDAKFCIYCAAPVGGDAPTKIYPDYTPPTPPTPPPMPPTPPPAPPAPPRPGLTWWPTTDRLSDLCASMAWLTLTILLTAQMLLQVWGSLFPFDPIRLIFGLVSQWPQLLFCIGGWVCFSGGRNNRITTTGFGMISGTLSFLSVWYCISSAVGFLIGLALLIKLPDDYQVIGMVVIACCGVSLWLTWTFWHQLRQPAYSARQVVLNGSGPVPAGLFSIVLLILNAAGNLLSLISALFSQSFLLSLYGPVYDAYYRIAYYLPDELAELLALFLPGWDSELLYLFDLFLAFAVPLVAALILVRLRGTRRNWVR